MDTESDLTGIAKCENIAPDGRPPVVRIIFHLTCLALNSQMHGQRNNRNSI